MSQRGVLPMGDGEGEGVMSDTDLIRDVARLWRARGGDAEGIEWCWRAIRDEVQRQQDEESDRDGNE